MEQKNNSVTSDGTKDDSSTIADVTKSSPNNAKPNVSGALLSDVDYWKQRCLAAEKCLEESPCDPDITTSQIYAWETYHKFIGLYGNDR